MGIQKKVTRTLHNFIKWIVNGRITPYPIPHNKFSAMISRIPLKLSRGCTTAAVMLKIMAAPAPLIMKTGWVIEGQRL